MSWLGFGDPQGIRVAGVDADGNLIAGSQQTASANGSAGHPRIAAGTSASVVAWEDFSTTTDFTNRIYAARVAHNGTVLDPGGIRLSSNETDETQVKLASSGDSFLLAWRRAGEPSTIQGRCWRARAPSRRRTSRSRARRASPRCPAWPSTARSTWWPGPTSATWRRACRLGSSASIATDGSALSAEDVRLQRAGQPVLIRSDGAGLERVALPLVFSEIAPWTTARTLATSRAAWSRPT